MTYTVTEKVEKIVGSHPDATRIYQLTLADDHNGEKFPSLVNVQRATFDVVNIGNRFEISFKEVWKIGTIMSPEKK